jgi:hypothetical protein
VQTYLPASLNLSVLVMVTDSLGAATRPVKATPPRLLVRNNTSPAALASQALAAGAAVQRSNGSVPVAVVGALGEMARQVGWLLAQNNHSQSAALLATYDALVNTSLLAATLLASAAQRPSNPQLEAVASLLANLGETLEVAPAARVDTLLVATDSLLSVVEGGRVTAALGSSVMRTLSSVVSSRAIDGLQMTCVQGANGTAQTVRTGPASRFAVRGSRIRPDPTLAYSGSGLSID